MLEAISRHVTTENLQEKNSGKRVP